MSFDVSAVPGTPSELLPLLEAAAAADCYVRPFPPKSFLWTGSPDGWSWGTESWMMSVRPRLIESGVYWRIEYSDDDGHNAILDIEHAMKILRGEPINWPGD